MNEVSKFCTETDHHPEWALNGRTLSVKLTSHFNDNKVSLKDYELANHMVYIYNKFGKERSYKYWSPTNEVEISVLLAICGVLLLHRYYWKRYETVYPLDVKPKQPVFNTLSDFTFLKNIEN